MMAKIVKQSIGDPFLYVEEAVPSRHFFICFSETILWIFQSVQRSGDQLYNQTCLDPYRLQCLGLVMKSGVLK